MLSACFLNKHILRCAKLNRGDFIVRSFFPLSAKACDIKSLLIVILIYIVASVASGIVLGLLSWVPLVGIVFDMASQLIGYYCLAGIVVAFMIYFKI